MTWLLPLSKCLQLLLLFPSCYCYQELRVCRAIFGSWLNIPVLALTRDRSRTADTRHSVDREGESNPPMAGAYLRQQYTTMPSLGCRARVSAKRAPQVKFEKHATLRNRYFSFTWKELFIYSSTEVFEI